MGKWESGISSSDSSAPNYLTAALALCVSLAQITARWGYWAFGKALSICLWLYIGTVGCIDIAYYVYYHRDQEVHADYTDIVKNQKNAVMATGLHTFSNNTVVLAFTCGAAATVLVALCVIWVIHNGVRTGFMIDGSFYGYLCAVGSSTCNTITQMASHVKSYKPGRCSLGRPVDTLPTHKGKACR